MEKNDTITCAVTPCAGCVMPSTASVFRAVNKDGFAAQNGCCCEDTNNGGWSGRGSNRNNGCDSCSRAQANSGNSRCNCGACDACNSNQRSSNKCDGNTRNSSGKNRSNGCDSCGWAQANNDCGECNSCNDCNDCGGCNSNQRSGNKCDGNIRNRSGQSRTPGMVYEEEHQLCKLHELEEAIRKGTLFSELYMPMRGECADACGAQLCEGQAEAFAAWELRLYLNTHPCDQQALQLFRKFARKADQPNYAGAFAFDDGCGDRWSWTDAPWPWEFNAACECGCNCE